MSQITKGIRSFLSLPIVYSLFGNLIGGDFGRRTLVNEYIQPKTGDRILDIGCGPADLISFMPKVEYIGFDLSQDYINSAQNKYGYRASFFCEEVNLVNLQKKDYFDIVLAIGVLHHLDDSEALKLFELAKAALKPKGRLITFDGVYTKNQSSIARWIISKDRGQNVRTKEGYLNLASVQFLDIATHIRHDLLRIPYTHIILECIK